MDTGIVIGLVLVVAIVGILGYFMFLVRQERRGSGESETAGHMQVATAGVSSSRVAQTDFPEDYEPVYPAERENELPLSLVVNYLMGLVNDGENVAIRNKLREQGCYWNPIDRSEPIKDFKITFSVDTGDGKKVELGGLSSLMSRWGRDFLTNPATAPERPAETTKEERDESFRKELEENTRKEVASEEKEPAKEEKSATVTPPKPQASAAAPEPKSPQGYGSSAVRRFVGPPKPVEEEPARQTSSKSRESGSASVSGVQTAPQTAPQSVPQAAPEKPAASLKPSVQEMIERQLRDVEPEVEKKDSDEDADDEGSGGERMDIADAFLSFRQKESGREDRDDVRQDPLPKAKDFPRGENGVPEDVLEILRNPLKGMVGLCIYMNKRFGLGIDYSGMDFTGAPEQAEEVKEVCRNLSFDELCSFVRLSRISFEAMLRAERDLSSGTAGGDSGRDGGIKEMNFNI